MFLDEVDFDGVHDENRQSRPLIVTKETPRKSYFKRINRDQKGVKKMRRFRDSGVTLRGNSWAGNANGQRVVIKINPVKNKSRKINSSIGGGGVSAGGSGANLSAHIGYISRSGAGEDEEKAVLFDKVEEGIDGKEFFERSRDDRHHFRMIVSPENGSDIGNFREYIRDVMEVVEKDLGSELDWVSAVHYDTDDIHAHVVIRGRNDRDQDLVIARDYIASGIRMRAQEIATELLGQRSIDEIRKSMEAEIDALRVTSLDRFIDGKLDEERKVDVRLYNNFGKSQHYEQIVKGRLHYLRDAGLATENPPGVFKLDDDFRDVLYGIQNRNNIMSQMHGRLDAQELEGLSLYSIKAGEGDVVEGVVQDRGFTDEITDKKYLIVKDMGQGLHYVPIGGNPRAENLEKGSLIRVRPGDKSSGKADFNIRLIARKNDGVYDPALHKEYIEKEMDYIEPENRAGYLDSHIKRLETLEQNGVVTLNDEGLYDVPDDIIDQGEEITKLINERENKRFFPRIDVLSDKPLAGLIAAEKTTWIDKELYKQSIGKPSLSSYSEEVAKAIEDRKAWLIDKDIGFIQSNGAFALRDGAFRSLKVMEVLSAGNQLAAKLDTTFNQKQVIEGQDYSYVGYLTLESGHWSVVQNPQGEVQMGKVAEVPELDRRKVVVFEANEKGELVTKPAQRQMEQLKAQDIDRDEELER